LLRSVVDRLAELEEVLECYQLIGDIDFLLKAATKDMVSCTDFVNHRLTGIPG
jgi:DNA-binding Lrp family transcriptional regulator